jgi:hypothetical protein
MSEETLRKLETYKTKHNYTDAALSRKLGIFGNYLFRWRKAGKIKGAYERIVEEFLEKERANGEF